MGLMDMINKVIGTVQNATSTAQNAKYTYDNAKNTANNLKPQAPAAEIPAAPETQSNQPQ